MPSLSDDALAQLFVKARTSKIWNDQPVAPSVLEQLYDLVKLCPTSANCQPARFVFIQQVASKEKLRPALSAGNVACMMAAPVVVIVAHDPLFYEQMPRLYPEQELRSWFIEDIPFAEETAFRNSTLEGGYLILAARALGLDVAPISGFDNNMVDELFLEKQGWRSNFLVGLGYANCENLPPRAPRLDFDEACLIL